MSLELVPVTLSEAHAFVREHHRHHGAAQGGLFAVGVCVRRDFIVESGTVVGVAVIGRPVARLLADSWTAEVTRLCVAEGFPNACSMLYAAAWRACRALGYKKLITYILDTEPGTSPKAAGWKCVGEAGGGSWNRTERPRIDKAPLQGKLRFEVTTR